MKILVVGQMGYHEKTTVEPILNGLLKRGHYLERVGGNWDFFIPENYDKLIGNYISSIPKSLENWDIIFFVDYWNMVVPMLDYLRSVSNKGAKFVALFHGSVRFENDVAKELLHASEYEEYLLHVYDTIIVHAPWVKEIMGNLDNIKCAFWPFAMQFDRVRPDNPPVRKVIYAHRFDDDKGKDRFIEFVNYCEGMDIEFIVTDEPHKVPSNIKSVGRLTQEQLKELCKGGGYTWSSVKSEMAHLAIMDTISYGLTPLLNYHPAYYYFDNRYKYHSYEEALRIIDNGIVLSNMEWGELRERLDNMDNMVNAIEGK